MNSLQRVLATLAGKPVDRRAVAPVLSLYGARLTGCPLDQYYQDPQAYANGQSAIRETFGPDILFGPFAFALIGEAFGSELHPLATQAPNIKRPAIASPSQFDRLHWPNIASDTNLSCLRQAVRLMVARHKDIPIAMALPAPTDLPALFLGLETWMETLLFDTPIAERILARSIDFFVELANAFFTDGTSFVAIPCALATPALVTREIATVFTRPAMEKALSQLRGPVVLTHAGTPVLAHLDLLIGLPQTKGIGMDQEDNLDQARAIAGPELTLLGGLAGPNLSTLSKAEILRQCNVILANRRQDTRFLLYTAGADIPLDTPLENIHALRQATELGQTYE